MRIESLPECKTSPEIYGSFKTQDLEPLVNKVYVYTLSGKTINELREERDSKKLSSLHFVGDENDKLVLSQRSLLSQIAIFPPQEFFVPNTSGASRESLSTWTQKDEEYLMHSLGLKKTKQVTPNTATLAEVVFQHFDQTGISLLDTTHGITYNPNADPGCEFVCVGGRMKLEGLGLIFPKNEQAPIFASGVRMLIPAHQSSNQ